MRPTKKWLAALPVVDGYIVVPSGSYEKYSWPGNCRFKGESMFKAGSKFENGSMFGYYSIFGDRCEFGVNCEFQKRARFGDNSEIGNWAKIGKEARFGTRTSFGDGLKWNGILTDHIFTLSNVGGEGKQVKIARGQCGNIRIEVGRFRGTDDELLQFAWSIGKPEYMNLIGAFCRALKEER